MSSPRSQDDLHRLCLAYRSGLASDASPADKAASRKAAAELIDSETALVRWWLNRYRVPQTRETVGSGQLGILEAAKRWSPERSKWSHYAQMWIRKWVYEDNRRARGKEALTPDGEVHHGAGDMRQDLGDMSAQGTTDAHVVELYRRVNALPKLEQLVIRARFGLYGCIQPDPNPMDPVALGNARRQALREHGQSRLNAADVVE